MSIIIRPSLQDGDKNRGKPGPGVETPGYSGTVPFGTNKMKQMQELLYNLKYALPGKW
jgi:hypothetical protein